jgi:hypothetical protein
MTDDLTFYLDLSEEELAAELGAQLLGAGRQFGSEDFERYRALGDRWFREHLGEIRSAVCADARLQALYERGDMNRLVEAATIADALSAMMGGVPLGAASALVMKYGLSRLCGWSS